MFNFLKKKNILKIGEYGKCIDDRGWNDSSQSLKLEYGKKYKILQVVKCPTCGSVTYDIGCKFTDSASHTNCTRGKKGHKLPAQGIHLAGDFRFEKAIESQEEIEKQIEECVRVENYEKAEELKKQLEKV